MLNERVGSAGKCRYVVKNVLKNKTILYIGTQVISEKGCKNVTNRQDVFNRRKKNIRLLKKFTINS